MKKTKKNCLILLGTICVAILILFTYFNIENHNINNIWNFQTSKAKQESLLENFSYIVYDNQDESKIKALVTIENDNGIEYCIKPDNSLINCNNQKKLCIDIECPIDSELIFKVKPVNGDEIQKKVLISQEYINNQFKLTDISTSDEYTEIQVEYDKIGTQSLSTYFLVCDDWNQSGKVWANYTNNIRLDVMDIENRTDEIGQKGIATLHLKNVDQGGNVLYAHKTCSINSTTANIFNSLQHKGKTPDYYISNVINGTGCTRFFEPHNVGISSPAYNDSASVEYVIPFENLNLDKVKKINMNIFNYHQRSGGTASWGKVYTSITLNYTDGTNVQQSEGWKTATWTQEQETVQYEIRIDQRKTISEIRVYIEIGGAMYSKGVITDMIFDVRSR